MTKQSESDDAKAMWEAVKRAADQAPEWIKEHVKKTAEDIVKRILIEDNKNIKRQKYSQEKLEMMAKALAVKERYGFKIWTHYYDGYHISCEYPHIYEHHKLIKEAYEDGRLGHKDDPTLGYSSEIEAFAAVADILGIKPTVKCIPIEDDE